MTYGQDHRSFFSERLMRKVPEPKELVLSALTAVIAGVICAVSAVYLKVAAVIIWAAAVYGAYYLIGSLMVKEYEYILTDGVLDIDLITAKRSRKRLKSIEITECSEGGKAEPGMEGEYLCPAKKSDNLYYLVRTHNGAKETVIIDPNQMMKDAFGCYMGKSFKK